MFTILLQALILASGGIVSIGSITIVILLLISDRGWRSGVAYMLGYVGGYTLIGVAAVWAGTAVAANGSGLAGSGSSILLIALGLVLLWLGGCSWRNPPAASEAPPRLLAIVDRITPVRAFGFGALVTLINFKNLAIFLSAVSVPLLSDLPLPRQLVVVLLVVFVFCLSVIGPVAIYALFPRQAARWLNGIKQALETHRRPIGIWLPLVFGLIFLIRGLSGLL